MKQNTEMNQCVYLGKHLPLNVLKLKGGRRQAEQVVHSMQRGLRHCTCYIITHCLTTAPVINIQWLPAKRDSNLQRLCIKVFFC